MKHMVTAVTRHAKLARFIVTGGFAAVTEYVCFVLLHHLGLHLLLANSLSFMCGLVVSFSMNRLWVFRSQGTVGTQFGMYFVLALVNLCISDLLIWTGTNKLSISPLIAKLVVMVLVAAWNYVLYTRIIFVHRQPAG